MKAVWRTLGLAVMLLVVAIPAAANRRPIYTVQAISGTVLTRTPTAARWRTVRRGDRLLQGQLIQVTQGAFVTFEEQLGRAAAGMNADRVQLTLSQPLVARLGPDLLRQVEVSTLFLDKVPDVGLSGAPVVLPKMLLKDAWQKIAALVTGISTVTTRPSNLAELERLGVSLALSAKRLQLVTPPQNFVVQAEVEPVSLRAVWIRPAAFPSDREYYIYVWPVGAARQAPRAKTRQEFYTVPLTRPGTYFVQVTSTDGVWQSAAHAVHVVKPATNSVASGTGAASMIDLSERLRLDSPPDRYVAVGKADSIAIVFAWQHRPRTHAATVELQITNVDSGQMVRRIASQAEQVSVALPTGRYSWQLAAPKKGWRSTSRRFEIIDPQLTQSSADRRRLIQGWLKGDQSVAVSLEQGL